MPLSTPCRHRPLSDRVAGPHHSPVTRCIRHRYRPRYESSRSRGRLVRRRLTGRRRGIEHFLAKPFLSSALVTLLERIVGSLPPGGGGNS